MESEIFGLRMGMTVDEIEVEHQISADSYLLLSVPKPHSAFDSYIATISDAYGLVSITAISNTIKTPPDGSSLIREYLNMREKLEKKYGYFYEIDELNEHSIWYEEGEFMAALECNDRDLFSIWEFDSLKNNPQAKTLSAIVLIAKSDENLDGYFNLTYRFLNFDTFYEDKVETEDECL